MNATAAASLVGEAQARIVARSYLGKQSWGFERVAELRAEGKGLAGPEVVRRVLFKWARQSNRRGGRLIDPAGHRGLLASTAQRIMDAMRYIKDELGYPGVECENEVWGEALDQDESTVKKSIHRLKALGFLIAYEQYENCAEVVADLRGRGEGKLARLRARIRKQVRNAFEIGKAALDLWADACGKPGRKHRSYGGKNSVGSPCTDFSEEIRCKGEGSGERAPHVGNSTGRDAGLVVLPCPPPRSDAPRPDGREVDASAAPAGPAPLPASNPRTGPLGAADARSGPVGPQGPAGPLAGLTQRFEHVARGAPGGDGQPPARGGLRMVGPDELGQGAPPGDDASGAAEAVPREPLVPLPGGEPDRPPPGAGGAP